MLAGLRNAPVDPVGRLRQKVRKDLGRRIAITDVLAQAIHALYEANRSWSYQLYYDNLVAWAEAESAPDGWFHEELAEDYAALGRDDEAREQALLAVPLLVENDPSFEADAERSARLRRLARL